MDGHICKVDNLDNLNRPVELLDNLLKGLSITGQGNGHSGYGRVFRHPYGKGIQVIIFTCKEPRNLGQYANFILHIGGDTTFF